MSSVRYWHSLVAILAGFLTMAVPTGIATTLMGRLAPVFSGREKSGRPPASQPSRRYMALNLAYTSIFAAMGGYVTARVSLENQLGHFVVLALVVLFLGGVSAAALRGEQPLIFQLAQVAGPPVAVLLGGWWRIHG